MQIQNKQKVINKGHWSEQEQSQFNMLVLKYGIGKWKSISSCLNRTATQCQIHYFKQKAKLRLTDDQMKDYLTHDMRKLEPDQTAHFQDYKENKQDKNTQQQLPFIIDVKAELIQQLKVILSGIQ
uniref:Myb-like DNA-binding domain-containing protein n=1 Tax=Trepomonas sp. PC1 TaxID=1076344 RepID=A0A146KNA2_9EUKA|eukprot:JAP96529.1 Myb-like DNA-binding domain-containing protein [Trepomonas sp. PC1]